MRLPRVLDRSTSRLPKPVRTLLDWTFTIAVAAGGVLVFQAEVAKPFRIPTASMEPTLHCAAPGSGCRARFSDRVIADRLSYRFRKPRRNEIVVFRIPERALTACGTGADGDVYLKRIVGLPGETVKLRNGYVFANGRRVRDAYVAAGAARACVGDVARPGGRVLRSRRQQDRVVRLASVGLGPARQDDRPGSRHVLAADAARDPLT